MIVGQMTDLVDVGVVAFTRDSDLDLIEKALPANIKLLETLFDQQSRELPFNDPSIPTVWQLWLWLWRDAARGKSISNAFSRREGHGSAKATSRALL